MVAASADFVPIFVDTLARDQTTVKRFKERFGSYPVLRVHDHASKDIGGRIDGNPVAGKIPVKQLLAQLAAAKKAFDKARAED